MLISLGLWVLIIILFNLYLISMQDDPEDDPFPTVGMKWLEKYEQGEFKFLPNN